MKKILLALLISNGLFADSISIDISCEQLREYETKCVSEIVEPIPTETKKYFYDGSIVWGIGWNNGKDSKPYAGQVKIHYLDDNLNTSGTFKVSNLIFISHYKNRVSF